MSKEVYSHVCKAFSAKMQGNFSFTIISVTHVFIYHDVSDGKHFQKPQLVCADLSKMGRASLRLFEYTEIKLSMPLFEIQKLQIDPTHQVVLLHTTVVQYRSTRRPKKLAPLSGKIKNSRSFLNSST